MAQFEPKSLALIFRNGWHNLNQSIHPVGVHYTQIGRYESKGVKPSGDVLAKIASTLGVTSDFLLSGSSQEQAQASLKDRELLSQFQRVEQLPNEKKAIVKELLESFLLKCDIQKGMA